MTWQKFYEIYDLYGSEENAWKDFLGNEKVEENLKPTETQSTTDFMSWLKGIDLDSVREGVNSLQRVIGVMQDFGSSKAVNQEEYKPRPLYKHFDD